MFVLFVSKDSISITTYKSRICESQCLRRQIFQMYVHISQCKCVYMKGGRRENIKSFDERSMVVALVALDGLSWICRILRMADYYIMV